MAVEVALAQNALVELAVALSELGLDADPTGLPVTRRINAASAAIRDYLMRTDFFWSLRSEVYGSPGQPLQARIPLRTTPVWPPAASSVIQVTLDLDPEAYEGTVPLDLVSGEDYYVEDYALGWLFRVTRWPTTALARPDIVQDSDPQAIELTTQVVYLAGWVTPVQVDQAVAWPGASTQPSAGTLISPAGQPNQLWGCTPQSVTPGATAGATPIWPATGLVEPSWPAAPTINQLINDGSTAWTFLGWGPGVDTYPQARTLPPQIEQACIDTVVSWYRRMGTTVEPTASKFGNASQTYGTRLGLPTTAIHLLNPFRQGAVG